MSAEPTRDAGKPPGGAAAAGGCAERWPCAVWAAKALRGVGGKGPNAGAVDGQGADGPAVVAVGGDRAVVAVGGDRVPFPSRTTTSHPQVSKEQRGTGAPKAPR